jgi:hypothetical protein
MPKSSNNTLLTTVEWAKAFNFGRMSAVGNYLSPAISSANMIVQTFLGPPFCWRWNRVLTGFIASPGVQDYTLTNWNTTTSVSSKWYVVDSGGYSQKVTTPGVTGSTTPSWNETLGGTTTDGTVVWTNQGLIPVDLPVSPTFTFNWMETQSVYDLTLTTPKWVEIQSKISLGLDSTQARPKFISAQADDGLGDITFRLMQCPDAAYPVAITIQQKPPVFTSVNQTWAPIPDEYSHIYNWGFLALMWMFADDSRFVFANQKFIAHLLAANQGLNQTEINIFLNNWQEVTGQPIQKATMLQQGSQGRMSQ